MSAKRRSKPRRSPVSRRDFLAVGGLSVVGLSMAERAALAAQARRGVRTVLQIIMNGGASHLETFDPKPDAPGCVRGPLRSIATAIPGVAFAEGMPRLAARADRLTIVRSLYHDAPPLHETGLQLLQSGRVAARTTSTVSLGSAVSRLLGPQRGAPPYVVLPRPVTGTGVRMNCGTGAGWLGDEYAPLVLDQAQLREIAEDKAIDEPLISAFDEEPLRVRERYGESAAGRSLWQAARLVECGVRAITVNLCPRLDGEVTWDAHAHKSSAPATLFDYRDTIGPQFDCALAALLDELDEIGLLHETLVLCSGEFGRTPWLNADGGRDHWPHCWSALVAGGGTTGGRVIGASDKRGERPADAPISVSAFVATAYQALHIDPREPIEVAGRSRPLLDVDPVPALLA